MNLEAKSKPKTKKRREPWSWLDVVALLLFFAWTALGLYFTAHRITADTIATWSISPGLKQFVVSCFNYGDPILILLAFINTHLHAARQWSGGAARQWGVLILASAYGIEACGTKTGFPFGAYEYTDAFGPMLGPVPLAIPLAWHVVITNALFLVRAPLPNLSQLTEAILAGMICTAYDFILEPFATTQKHYWIWAEGSVPPLNYLAWFVLSALLVRVFAPTLTTMYRLDPRPLLILGLTVAIFVAGELR